MILRTFALLLVVTSSAFSGGAVAEDSGRGATQITANYGVYFAGLHFGDVRLVMTVGHPDYEMKGEGRFSLLSGLIFDWHGSTMSKGQLGKSGPKPSLYTLSYSGGGKQGDVRIAFAEGDVAQVLTSPTKRPDPRDIPVTKEQLAGVLDPMTGAFLRERPKLQEADLKVCDETIPVFDGQIRFDIVLMPKQQRRVASKTPSGYSGLAAVCRVKFVPISGSRPDNPAIKYMSSHTDSIEVWLVPLPRTTLYVPYRISLPTTYGSGSAELLSFQVTEGRASEASSKP